MPFPFCFNGGFFFFGSPFFFGIRFSQTCCSPVFASCPCFFGLFVVSLAVTFPLGNPSLSFSELLDGFFTHSPCLDPPNFVVAVDFSWGFVGSLNDVLSLLGEFPFWSSLGGDAKSQPLSGWRRKLPDLRIPRGFFLCHLVSMASRAREPICAICGRPPFF